MTADKVFDSGKLPLHASIVSAESAFAKPTARRAPNVQPSFAEATARQAPKIECILLVRRLIPPCNWE
ncbi:MAG: hypothetical protein DMF45_11915 [Verrucomicrobia bacterium]|nr:MAG: hypothetical protein DMF45_11915 [Verrucomicrobiota bacterium]